MDQLNDFIEFIEFTGRSRHKGPKRYLRDYSDPFRKYSTRDFYSRYRFSPDTVKNSLVPILEPFLRKSSKRGLPFAPEVMILVTLRYYATGTSKQLGEDVVKICQQSLSRIINLVSTILAKQTKNIVKFPPLSELPNVKTKFCDIAGFPGVIGCIGCTHIKIKSPGGPTAEIYKNRKGWFSVNVQAVTGPNLEFYDLVVRWPGSCHDSFIYNNSSVKQRLNNELPGILLGNNQYALSPILMTPYLSPSNLAQEKYNRSHVKTRNSIEQAFGIWKRRFPCLQFGMGIKLETTVAVICACATLYNFAILHNDQDLDQSPIDQDLETNYNVANMEVESDGFLARENLVLKYFSN